MNFVFVSPHFPRTYWNFCDRLHRNGVNVLGIGDASFDEIPWELKHCLTEYYRVSDLGSYDEMLRAMAYFTFHYGKIDWVESNNEYWLEMDAQMRTDFNINSGAKNDFIERIKYKSRMKESYIAAGVPVARHHMVSTLAAARAFIKEVGYPVIVKPDNGCGAEATYKLKNFADLKAFYAKPRTVPYIMEEFINGTIVSFDGVADSHCVPLFYTSNVFPIPMLDIVSAGFQMSFLAVITLGIMIPLIQKKIKGILLPMIAVQTGMVPYTMYVFNYVSLTSVISNIPVYFIAAAMIPAGISVIAFCWLPVIAKPAAMITGLFVKLLLWCNDFTYMGGVFTFDVASFWPTIPTSRRWRSASAAETASCSAPFPPSSRKWAPCPPPRKSPAFWFSSPSLAGSSVARSAWAPRSSLSASSPSWPSSAWLTPRTSPATFLGTPQSSSAASCGTWIPIWRRRPRF